VLGNVVVTSRSGAEEFTINVVALNVESALNIDRMFCVLCGASVALSVRLGLASVVNRTEMGCEDVLVTVAALKPWPEKSETKNARPGICGDQREMPPLVPLARAENTGALDVIVTEA
jgi:hypothetical protein